MTKNPVFSPTQTAVWLQCPTRRHLSYVQGWRPKGEGTSPRYAASLVGTGFAAGVAVWNLNRKHGGSVSIESIVEVALAEANNRKSLDEKTFGPIPSDDSLEPKLTKAITAYCSADPLPTHWEIVSVEETLDGHGRARPDLVLRDDLGLAVLDYKVKMRVDERSRLKVIAEYGNSHQLLHYSWAVQDVKREPVQRYYIGLVVLEPKVRIDVLPYEVNPETLSWWAESMKPVWQKMQREEDGLDIPWIAAKHYDEWGRCEFEEACFRLRREPELMRTRYVTNKQQGEVNQ